jgi:hypothetical protein
MELILIFSVLILVLFGAVIFFGAPYLPTHSPQIDLALDKLDLKPGELLYELGSGDGKVLIHAAKKGYKAVGYEINPLLYAISMVRTRKYRNSIQIILGNYWKADISKADGVYVFLLDRFMERLDKKLCSELRPGTKLASYVFKIPGKKPIMEADGVFIYQY